MPVAAEAEFYNDSYSDPESAARLPAATSPLAPLYHEVRLWLSSNTVVHDLGCGTGQLGETLLEGKGVAAYHGVDFSYVATRSARERLARFPQGEWSIVLSDLREWQQPEDVFNVVFISLETLEHLERDRLLLRKIQPGRRVIFSVPSYDSASHVRWFPNLSDVWDRYQPLVTINRWSRIEVGASGGSIHLLDTVRRGDNW